MALHRIPRRTFLGGVASAAVAASGACTSGDSAVRDHSPDRAATEERSVPQFPSSFLWGAATAGHQIEGGNVLSDIWAAEMAANSVFLEPSGDACDSYHRFDEDIRLLAEAGLNCYRFSLEWSRIEPEPGWFARGELDHYRRMIATCHEHDVTPVVTYSHFSTPRWFADLGGWAAADAPDRFGTFCERATKHLGDLIPWACTLNEPNVMANIRYIGTAPVGGGGGRLAEPPLPLTPERTEAIATVRGASGETTPATLPGFQGLDVDVMAAIHRRGVEAIRSGRGDTKVGWTLALIDVQAIDGGEARPDEASQRAQLDWLDVSADDDFVGVQTYSKGADRA